MSGLRRVLIAGALLLRATCALAQAAGHADAGAAASATDAPASGAFCVEQIPEGKPRPKVTESFPDKGLVGHVARLEVVVEHGKGETVLPDGFQFQLAGDHLADLERSGFLLPDPEGEAAPTIERTETDDRATTRVVIKFVPVPKTPGRHELRLPPLPIAIARASGEVMTVCTTSHQIVVDEPIANENDPMPQPNPAPRRQLEEWTWLKNFTYASVVALLVGALLGWLLVQWLRRPRPTRPPPPPRPPWEVAIEELYDIRHAGLVEAGRYAEHYDRVSYTVRKYLGDRYGFDGLESTTREILGVLRRVKPSVAALDEIEPFLKEADLVKFAKLTPTSEQCRIVLDRGDSIVRRTVPQHGSDAASPPPVPPPETPQVAPAEHRGAPPGGES